MDEEAEARRLEGLDRSRDLDEISSVIKEGRVLEIGCGPGNLIEPLSKRFPGSHFVGIDISEYMIRRAKAKNLENAEFRVMSGWACNFQSDSFDSILVVDVLHEVKARQWSMGIPKILENGYLMLKPGGRLIIRDGMRPEKLAIRVKFDDASVRKKFGEFDQFVHRVARTVEGEWITLDVSDFVEFFIKLRGREWEVEGGGWVPNLIYSREEYLRLLKHMGFKRIDVREYGFPADAIPRGIVMDPPSLPMTYCMLVCQKP